MHKLCIFNHLQLTPRFRNVLCLCLRASLSSKIIESCVITECAINTNSHISCYFISQKRAVSEIFSYLQTYRILKILSSPMVALLPWGGTKRKQIKLKNYSFTSFCLKLAMLGKSENYTAETATARLSAIARLSIKSSSECQFSRLSRLCPSPLFSSPHLWSFSALHTQFLALLGQSQAWNTWNYSPDACSATPFHAAARRACTRDRPLASPPAALGLGWAGSGARGIPTERWHPWGQQPRAQHPGERTGRPRVLRHTRLMPKGGTGGTGCSPALACAAATTRFSLTIFLLQQSVYN